MKSNATAATKRADRPVEPELPDEDDVLWRMLNTPPRQHSGVTAVPKPDKPNEKKKAG